MRTPERVNLVKLELREAMVRAIFEPLARTHLEALEKSHLEKERFPHSEHIWTINRTQSIWTISCEGLYDWNVSFDTDWFTGPCGDRYQSIDTFVFNDNLIADTVRHLAMAIEFVSHYLASTNPDGSVKL